MTYQQRMQQALEQSYKETKTYKAEDIKTINHGNSRYSGDYSDYLTAIES
tara:strand:- start:84 stop:233 length:150 start_codon:yes stop_codon:yes gene_type:complete